MFFLISSFSTILLAVHLVFGAPKGAKNSEWLKYSELQSLNATCSEIDTCTTPRVVDNLDDFICECKISCTNYRTCCIDSPYRDTRPSFISKETCHSVFGAGRNLFMIKKCNTNWIGDPIIIANCESKKQDFSDPLAAAPVTNPKTCTTYKNYFCAICNDDDQNSNLWDVFIDATFYFYENSSNEDVIDQLIYNDEMDMWGIWEYDPDSGWRFSTVYMQYRIPKNMESVVKVCRPDLITDCAPDWKDELIRKKCQAYMAAAYVFDRTTYLEVGYHNPHCAICNHVYNFTSVCQTRYGGGGGSFGGGLKPSLSFSLLLDINRSDGDKVGEVNRCASSEVYDRFSRKCRALVCAFPGYVIRDNKCTKI